MVLTMGAIFKFSSQNGDKSSNISEKTAEAVVVIINKLGMPVSKNPSSATFQAFHTIVRKLAHFTAFMVLSMSATAFFATYWTKDKRNYIYPLMLCFAYACSDEFHQLFSQGRSAQFTDVLIDTVGGAVGIIIVMGAINLYFYLKNIRKSN